MEESLTYCERLKEQLIEKINAYPCDQFIENFDFIKILMADELSKEQSSVMTGNGQIYLDYLPSSFKINNLDIIFHAERQREWNYLHIYFIFKDNNVSLLFWFNNDSKNLNHNSLANNSAYILENEDLTYDPIDAINYPEYINGFTDYYLNVAKYTNITTYITYPMDKVNANFIKYDSCFFLRGGKLDNGVVRPNLILEILKANCRVLTISTGRFVHFDMGDLRP